MRTTTRWERGDQNQSQSRGAATKQTYKSNISSRDEERCAGDTNKSQLPDEGETKDGSKDDGRDGLHNGAEGDTSKTIDFLWVITELGGQGTSVILILVKILNWKPHHQHLFSVPTKETHCLGEVWP